MCISISMSDWERLQLRGKLTKATLDEWLEDQTGRREYENSLQFFQQFGVHIGLDRQVSVPKMYQANQLFVDTVVEHVSSPQSRSFGAARQRLLRPQGYDAARELSLLPA